MQRRQIISTEGKQVTDLDFSLLGQVKNCEVVDNSDSFDVEREAVKNSAEVDGMAIHCQLLIPKKS